jgi:hypothetical protein
MRSWDFSQLENEVHTKKADVEKKILAGKLPERVLRMRPRDPGEQAVLDQIAIQKWRDAEEAGKIKYLSKTEWYYEY